MATDNRKLESARPALSAPFPPNVNIRFAAPGDLPRLTTLFEAYRAFYGCESNPCAAAAFLAARLLRRESVVLLALLDAPAGGFGEIIGFAQLFHTFSSLSLRSVIILNDLFVVPAVRRLGIGSRLVDEAATYARRAGAARLDLEARPDNTPALRLYREKGFVANADFHHMSLSLDELSMSNP